MFANPTGPKPYPRYCARCRAYSMQRSRVPHRASIKHDGKVHEFSIRSLIVDKCESCAYELFTGETDEQLSAELRKHLGLLQPREILAGLQSLGLSQKAFAERLGVAAETVSRWVNGFLIQSRAMDNLMRVFLAYPQVRDSLVAGGPSPLLGLAPAGAGPQSVSSAAN
jgi:putative zinc finger/helix-turn-helix YgiT family protein